MQIYPGYTVAKIEEECSYREIDELSKYWHKAHPNFWNVDTIKQLIAGYMQVDLTAQAEKPSIDGAIEAFKLIGIIE